jgi:hypothetical protein
MMLKCQRGFAAACGVETYGARGSPDGLNSVQAVTKPNGMYRRGVGSQRAGQRRSGIQNLALRIKILLRKRQRPGRVALITAPQNEHRKIQRLIVNSHPIKTPNSEGPARVTKNPPTIACPSAIAEMANAKLAAIPSSDGMRITKPMIAMGVVKRKIFLCVRVPRSQTLHWIAELLLAGL